MRYDEADVLEDKPGAATLYGASLIGSAFVFLMLLALFCIAALWNGSSIGTAMAILIVGGLWGAFVAIVLAFLVAGPIGTVIGLALTHLAPSGQWHGAANGAATGTSLLALAVALSPGGTRNLDTETLLFAAALVIAGAIAGWMVQRWFLGWPVRPERSPPA